MHEIFTLFLNFSFSSKFLTVLFCPLEYLIMLLLHDLHHLFYIKLIQVQILRKTIYLNLLEIVPAAEKVTLLLFDH